MCFEQLETKSGGCGGYRVVVVVTGSWRMAAGWWPLSELMARRFDDRDAGRDDWF